MSTFSCSDFTECSEMQGWSILSYLLMDFSVVLCENMCALVHVKLRSAFRDVGGGLSNINMQWHGPNWRVNRGEEGLKQQSSESTAPTGENNLQSPDPRAFTPAQTNSHCKLQICECGRKNGGWKMTLNETLLQFSIVTERRVLSCQTQGIS